MEILLVSFIGGIVGSVFMDITEAKMSKLGISSGVKGTYIGRWVQGILGGVFHHQDIAKSQPVKNEARIGQIFHFVVGGGVVALFYPVFLSVIDFGFSSNHLMMSLVFGLFTSVLPWFILMPSFGWGLFGSKAPVGSRPVLSPILSHIPYGLGIGITFIMFYEVMA